MITIYTDGAARGNPGPGGWGAVIANDERVVELGGDEPHTTNNRMELTACIRALEYVSDLEPNGSHSEIILSTDSKYAMKGITEWIKTWQKKGWKTAGKKPVLNQDLWQELLMASEGKDIKWKYVAGHAGVEANERSDEIATAFADGLEVTLYDGNKSSYPINF